MAFYPGQCKVSARQKKENIFFLSSFLALFFCFARFFFLRNIPTAFRLSINRLDNLLSYEKNVKAVPKMLMEKKLPSTSEGKFGTNGLLYKIGVT